MIKQNQDFFVNSTCSIINPLHLFIMQDGKGGGMGGGGKEGPLPAFSLSSTKELVLSIF